MPPIVTLSRGHPTTTLEREAAQDASKIGYTGWRLRERWAGPALPNMSNDTSYPKPRRVAALRSRISVRSESEISDWSMYRTARV